MSSCDMVARAAEQAGRDLLPTEWADTVGALLHEKREAASTRTFSNVLRRLPDMLSRAFTSPT